MRFKQLPQLDVGVPPDDDAAQVTRGDLSDEASDATPTAIGWERSGRVASPTPDGQLGRGQRSFSDDFNAPPTPNKKQAFRSAIKTVKMMPHARRKVTLGMRSLAAVNTCLEHDQLVFFQAILTLIYLSMVLVDLVVDELICDNPDTKEWEMEKSLIVAHVDLGFLCFFLTESTLRLFVTSAADRCGLVFDFVVLLAGVVMDAMVLLAGSAGDSFMLVRLMRFARLARLARISHA